MEPIHKLNEDNEVTLCKSCKSIITEGFTNDLLCTKCQRQALELLYAFKEDTDLAF